MGFFKNNNDSSSRVERDDAAEIKKLGKLQDDMKSAEKRGDMDTAMRLNSEQQALSRRIWPHAR